MSTERKLTGSCTLPTNQDHKLSSTAPTNYVRWLDWLCVVISVARFDWSVPVPRHDSLSEQTYSDGLNTLDGISCTINGLSVISIIAGDGFEPSTSSQSMYYGRLKDTFHSNWAALFNDRTKVICQSNPTGDCQLRARCFFYNLTIPSGSWTSVSWEKVDFRVEVQLLFKCRTKSWQPRLLWFVL